MRRRTSSSPKLLRYPSEVRGDSERGGEEWILLDLGSPNMFLIAQPRCLKPDFRKGATAVKITPTIVRIRLRSIIVGECREYWR
jgi:hypothetical protein